DALSRKSGMIAGLKVEEEIIRDLERLDVELYVRGQHGYWASLRIEPDLISRIKEAQKEDSEIWTIVEYLDKQVEFRLDDDNVLWQGTRLVVPNDATLREALLTEAYSSPFSVHPGNLNGYNEVQNVGNQVALNPRVHNVGNQNGLIGVQGNGIQNQIRNGNLVAVRVEGNAVGQNENQIRCYNCRGIGHYAKNYTARPRRRDAAG
nr:putative reverse transcriptase domain-containing protein [Tanacetum cinerariifolium]